MKRIVAMTLFLAICCSSVTAQQSRGRPGAGRPGQGQRGGGAGGGGGASRPGSDGSATLEGAGLKIGEALPTLTIFDDQGGEFRLTDLKGKHSVIVFGCLT